MSLRLPGHRCHPDVDVERGAGPVTELPHVVGVQRYPVQGGLGDSVIEGEYSRAVVSRFEGALAVALAVPTPLRDEHVRGVDVLRGIGQEPVVLDDPGEVVIPDGHVEKWQASQPGQECVHFVRFHRDRAPPSAALRCTRTSAGAGWVARMAARCWLAFGRGRAHPRATSRCLAVGRTRRLLVLRPEGPGRRARPGRTPGGLSMGGRGSGTEHARQYERVRAAAPPRS